MGSGRYPHREPNSPLLCIFCPSVETTWMDRIDGYAKGYNMRCYGSRIKAVRRHSEHERTGLSRWNTTYSLSSRFGGTRQETIPNMDDKGLPH